MTQSASPAPHTNAAAAIVASLARRAARMELALNKASAAAGEAREYGDAVSMRQTFEAQLMAQVRWEEADTAHRRAARIYAAGPA